jgi:hypothetical protein
MAIASSALPASTSGPNNIDGVHPKQKVIFNDKDD